MLASSIKHCDLDPLIYVTPSSHRFCFENIINEDLRCALNEMKSNKSAGPHKISIKLLKEAGDTIVQSLVTIFNLSLQTEIFPDMLKLARVSPFTSQNLKMRSRKL